jgi:hypothetical protein
VSETLVCECKKQLEESKNQSDHEEEKKTVIDNYEEVVEKIVCKH